MQNRKNVARENGWTRIPQARRHAYVYVLLFLGAVVGNDVMNAVNPTPSDEPTAAIRAEAARIEGMKESAISLYR